MGRTIEYRQLWVPARETERVAERIEAVECGAEGWYIHSVTFGERTFTPDGAGQRQHVEDGWLVLFSRHSYVPHENRRAEREGKWNTSNA